MYLWEFRTGRASQSQSDRGGGMSPVVLALLGLLAYKAFKGRTPRLKAVNVSSFRSPRLRW
jgi:hypothetical protein